MKEKTLKSISKLLVAVMIATIALPSGAFAGHGNYKQDKVMAAEVSVADSEQETTKENTETTKPAEETSTDESGTTETGTDETSTTEESSTTETTTEAPTTEVPTTEVPTINPDFVIENGVLTGYKKAATDTTNKEIVIPARKLNPNRFQKWKKKKEFLSYILKQYIHYHDLNFFLNFLRTIAILIKYIMNKD